MGLDTICSRGRIAGSALNRLHTCKKHLIVAVFDECYVAMPNGAVNNYHALNVPVEHKQQGALVDRQLTDEISVRL